MKYLNVGQLIKRLRNEKHLSMIDFASKINISQPALSKIENGSQEASLTILQSVCRECNISMSDFFNILNDEIDLSLDTVKMDDIQTQEMLKSELFSKIEAMTYEQQKALYILLFTQKK